MLTVDTRASSRYVKYNAVLRGLGSAQAAPHDKWKALCGENRYSTTLHVLNSAIVKLGKLTRVEKVYRGIAGGLLPESFWRANEHGVCGGVVTTRRGLKRTWTIHI